VCGKEINLKDEKRKKSFVGQECEIRNGFVEMNKTVFCVFNNTAFIER
jgi:hypothetical protein